MLLLLNGYLLLLLLRNERSGHAWNRSTGESRRLSTDLGRNHTRAYRGHLGSHRLYSMLLDRMLWYNRLWGGWLLHGGRLFRLHRWLMVRWYFRLRHLLFNL